MTSHATGPSENNVRGDREVDRRGERDASPRLIRALDQAGTAVIESMGEGSSFSVQVSALLDRLRQQRLQIAVLGQFKRGKSTVVNALLGAGVLPTGVIPLTAIPTFISWREEPLIRVQFSNSRPDEELAARGATGIRDILYRFVTEEANPKNRLGVDRVELFYPAPILAGGTTLIDTPGIGSTLAHNTEAALRILPECDASLFIVSADPPITEVELGYLRRLKPKIGRIFFVVNKVDYLTSDEQRAVTDFLRKALSEASLLDEETMIFGVSARTGLSAKHDQDREAWDKSGMAALEDHLMHYLATEKTKSLEEAIQRKAADLLTQAENEIELRVKALNMPLEQLQQKSSDFARSLVLIREQRQTINDLLAGDRRRLLAELEEKILTLRQDAASRLQEVIDDGLSRADGTWEDRVKAGVATSLEELFGNARERFVESFSRQTADILSAHGQRIDALVDQVRRTAAKLFDVVFATEAEPEAFHLVQEPYWVTERIASTLIPSFGRAIDYMLPKAMRRHRRQARIMEEADELIIRNAESLRWAILRGIDEAFRAAAPHFEERLSQAIAATQDVFDDALARRRDRSFAGEPELRRLDRAKEALRASRQSVLHVDHSDMRVT